MPVVRGYAEVAAMSRGAKVVIASSPLPGLSTAMSSSVCSYTAFASQSPEGSKIHRHSI